MVVLISLFLATVALRLGAGFSENALADTLVNFSPMAALLICAGLYFSSARTAFLVAFGALLVSDIALNVQWWKASEDVSLWGLFFGPSFLARYAVYAALFGFAVWMRRRGKTGAVSALLMTLSGSFLFYLVTNSMAWATMPAYAPGFAGWIQALTVGLPPFPPTWVFFRNALLGDLGFTLLFLAACRHSISLSSPGISSPVASQMAKS